MKHVFGLKKVLLASAVAASMVAPSMAAAEVSGSLAVSNMYFWRGQDISGGTANVSGSLDYSHSSGLYAGIWGSSVGNGTNGNGAPAAGTETDIYVGFGNEFKGLSYDLSYVYYGYPNQPNTDLSEVVASLGFAGVTAKGYIGVDNGSTDNSSNYYTLSYSYDKYSILAGTWDMSAKDTNYTHVDLSYALTDQLSFTVSQITAADKFAGVDDSNDPLFVVSYSFKI
ncbi:MAG: TorF family putative porin [Alcanivorax sp.]|nr:TorF family putative porin [Alcanivorax sp.]